MTESQASRTKRLVADYGKGLVTDSECCLVPLYLTDQDSSDRQRIDDVLQHLDDSQKGLWIRSARAVLDDLERDSLTGISHGATSDKSAAQFGEMIETSVVRMIAEINNGNEQGGAGQPTTRSESE